MPKHIGADLSSLAAEDCGLNNLKSLPGRIRVSYSQARYVRKHNPGARILASYDTTDRGSAKCYAKRWWCWFVLVEDLRHIPLTDALQSRIGTTNPSSKLKSRPDSADRTSMNLNRVLFNWGFHDGIADQRAGRLPLFLSRGVTWAQRRKDDKSWSAGWAMGVLLLEEGADVSTSDEGWTRLLTKVARKKAKKTQAWDAS